MYSILIIIHNSAYRIWLLKRSRSYKSAFNFQNIEYSLAMIMINYSLTTM